MQEAIDKRFVEHKGFSYKDATQAVQYLPIINGRVSMEEGKGIINRLPQILASLTTCAELGGETFRY